MCIFCDMGLALYLLQNLCVHHVLRYIACCYWFEYFLVSDNNAIITKVIEGWLIFANSRRPLLAKVIF